ncbi:hybrid sensor histidine kinase/response regulator [Cronbergia sp. UHCC 0137]|uniref:hybrid sensor histidine kinase/response regulator n=1 Tax=Cronbergia sp. UHCC 0137 TaxID=3110239 RepID=UPI002B20BE50|nr:hybrid sensor histidine kinase/response regulator [Cronbergia sp. UHCC 0137]MEA5616892.1 hybrid sensor histidine kinase/response regulator [Cronbergia sp. UHCC 0137]
MITDNSIREQGYAYFLTEAPELLQTIEQDLFTLAEDYSISKVHNLMRATHTIKGGAANVGLDTIQMIAHSLEDIFKALYNPDVVIDSELQSLLLDSYECLQLAVTAELTGSNINSEELLERASSVFVQLQTKLGDAFGTEPHIPTSEELGFDIVKSIFEVGVKQRLESIAEAINSSLNPEELGEFLHSQVEVFLGLAESLNLPGLVELSRTITAALEANPHQIYQIAPIALADLQQSQQAVLDGDRTSGGSPSTALQALANSPKNSSLAILPKNESTLTATKKSSVATFLNITTDFYQFLISGDRNTEPLKPANAKFYLKVIRYIFGWFNHQMDIAETELSLDLLVPRYDQADPVGYIEDWSDQFMAFVEDPRDSQNLCLYRRGLILIIILAITKFQYSVKTNNQAIAIIKKLKTQIRQLAKEYKNYPPISEQQKQWLDSPKLQTLLVFKEISPPIDLQPNENLLEAIWGGGSIGDTTNPQTAEEVQNDHYLESVTSSAIIETAFTDVTETNLTDDTIAITQQIEEKAPDSSTKNLKQPSFVRVNVEGLQQLNYLTGELLIYQKRRTVYDEQITELIERLTQQITRHQSTLNQLRDLPLQGNNLTVEPTQNFSAVNFDVLEMDVYTEFYLTLHTGIEETLQLQETAESLEFLLKQATQISDKKHSLTLSIIENLAEARMLPLGTILNRFPQMVNKLASIYGKSIELKLSGTQVLIDKAIAEKLYDPLLQLVRNAFDHGIESPKIRQQFGKPEQGLIEISAYNQGSQTVIEVRDDGQGLNLENIRERAIELNIIPGDDHARGYVHKLTESELIELMFSPGFTTANRVSEISGRGMGLDIVRTQLQSLNGSISVQSSQHQGTTFILKIPFSMTTDKLMLVQAGGVIYALLLDSIEKIVIPSPEQIREFEGKQILHWHTEEEEMMVNLLKLSELIYYNRPIMGNTHLNSLVSNSETGITKNPVLLLKRQQGILGLEVDQIIGEQELVIRPLGSAIAPPKYVYGCSSLANGNLILIIDGSLLADSQEITELSINLASQQQALPASQDTSTPLLAEFHPTNPEIGVIKKALKVVLVVDDAISLRQTLSLTLQKAGYQVLQAQHGLEALEQLQLHPEIAVIISDLEMPQMNGFELLSNIRQNPKFSKKPVMILTSRSSDKHRQLAQELGGNAYFTKPYLEHEFIATVDNLSRLA